MAIFKTYETFLNYAYDNLCCRESQVIFKVYTNSSKEININRTAVYSGDCFLPRNLVYIHRMELSNKTNGHKFEYNMIFEGISNEVDLVRLKLVFSNGTFYNFDCYKNDIGVCSIAEMI